jgi:hypothetical protein
MIGNPVPEMAARRHAEPGDMCAITPQRDSGPRPPTSLPVCQARLKRLIVIAVVESGLDRDMLATASREAPRDGFSSALLRGGTFLGEPGLVCEYDRLDAVAEAELLENVGDVCLDGGFADVELLSDLLVGQAIGDESEDVVLSCGELVQLFRRCGARDAGELPDHALGDRG